MTPAPSDPEGELDRLNAPIHQHDTIASVAAWIAENMAQEGKEQ